MQQDATILHIIFSVKNENLQVDGSFGRKIREFLEFTCLNQNCRLVESECLTDHLHILIKIRYELSVSRVVQDIKKASENWIIENYVSDFSWKPGYSAFSLTSEKIAGVVALIGNQKELHNFMSFNDELEIMINDGLEGIKY